MSMRQVKTGVSRKAQLEALSVGESTVLVSTSTLQQVQSAAATAIATLHKEDKPYQFSQTKALLVIEGEIPIPCSVVTRTQ